MNIRNLFTAGLAMLLYYSFWNPISSTVQGFTGGDSFWAPLTQFMVAILPFVIFFFIALQGVSDDRQTY